MIKESTLRLVILYQGESSQIFKALEELGELQAALCRYLHDPLKAPDISPIVDEIADCTIMLRQLSIIFGVALVDERITFKMDRLNKRLAKWQEADNAT